MTGMRSLFVLAILGTHGAFAADRQPELDKPELRERAEDLARAASQRFTDILEAKKQNAAQASSAEQSRPAGTLAPVWDWLQRSAQSYDHVVIAQLKSKDDWTTIVEQNKETSPPAAPARPELRGWSGLVELMRHWLARANRAYRNEIVAPLRMPEGMSVPAEVSPKEPVAAGATMPIAPAPAGKSAQREQDEDAVKREAEAADRQRREAEAAATKRSEDEAQSKQRAAAEAADIQRRADEDKRLAAAAEEKSKAQAEARARLIKEAEAKRAAEDAESKRRAEAQAAEAKRRAEVERRQTAEAEARRKAEEMRRQAEEADAAERRAVAEAEAEAKRKAEIDAEATRRMQAAAQAKDDARVAVGPSPAPTPSAPSEARAGPPAPASPVAEKENSGVALPSVPEKKPESPREVAKATANSRDEAVEIAQEGPSKPRKAKRVSAKSGKGRKLAYAKKVKRHAYKHRHAKRGRVFAGKPRWRGGEVVVGGCACRCGKVIFKPRRHRYVARYGYSAPRNYVVRKHRGARLTHRHRLHYID